LVGQSRVGSIKACVWQLRTQSSQGSIHLNFDTFRFEKSDGKCEKDYIEIRNGYTQYAPIIGRYCGPTMPQTIRSSTGTLWLRFVPSGKTNIKVAMAYEFVPSYHSTHNQSK